MRQRPRPCSPRAAAALCCALLLALAMTTAACGQGEGTEEAVPLPRDLIPPPTVPFEVVFYREAPLRGDAEGYFVWRQGNGLRRWDLVMLDEGKAVRGEFSIESDFSPGEHWGRAGMTCWWAYKTRPPSDEASLDCGQGAEPSSHPLRDALWWPTVVRKHWVSEQRIAGRVADCYSVWAPKYDHIVLCLDASEGIPLMMDALPGLWLTDAINRTESMVALSVSTAAQNLVIPVQLEPDPDYPVLDWLHQFEGTVSASVLQLPDLTQFEQ